MDKKLLRRKIIQYQNRTGVNKYMARDAVLKKEQEEKDEASNKGVKA